MYSEKFTFKNAKNVFNSLLIPPPHTHKGFRVLGKSKKHGFTLAEVLITLGIIGIIAAMTVPNLMQNWKKQERLTQLKVAYSILQNATEMAVAEH